MLKDAVISKSRLEMKHSWKFVSLSQQDQQHTISAADNENVKCESVAYKVYEACDSHSMTTWDSTETGLLFIA